MSNRAASAKSVGRITLRVKLSAQTEAGPLLTDEGADLLEQISAIGNLTKSAKRLGISYRHAWTLVQNLNHNTGYDVVEFRTGGKSGGGAHLTEPGEALLKQFRLLQMRLQAIIDETEPLIHKSLHAAGSVQTSKPDAS